MNIEKRPNGQVKAGEIIERNAGIEGMRTDDLNQRRNAHRLGGYTALKHPGFNSTWPMVPLKYQIAQRSAVSEARCTDGRDRRRNPHRWERATMKNIQKVCSGFKGKRTKQRTMPETPKIRTYFGI
jgi:hypothetical protein